MVEVFDHLAHQIVLLATHPRTGELRGKHRLQVLVSAGTLAELVEQERVRLNGRVVEIRDARPTDDPMLDVMLDDLSNRPPRAPIRIIADPRDAYLNQALGEMVAHRWVRLTPMSGATGNRYEVLDKDRLVRARATAANGLMSPTQCSTRDAYLALFATQLGLVKELAPEIPFRERSKVKRLLAQRNWLGKTVGDVFAMSAQMDRI